MDRLRQRADFLAVANGTRANSAAFVLQGRSRDELKALITAAWEGRADRGAEERKALEVLGLREQHLIEINRLREDPHLEMHARGG